MLDRFGEKIISPLDRLSPFSADDGLMAAFRVLASICQQRLNCGFIVELRNDRGDTCRIDSRLSDVTGVELVSLAETGQCDDLSVCDPKHSSVAVECRGMPGLHHETHQSTATDCGQLMATVD